MFFISVSESDLEINVFKVQPLQLETAFPERVKRNKNEGTWILQ